MRRSESQRSLTFTLASPYCKRTKQLSDSLRNRAVALKIAVGKVTFDEAGGAKAKCVLRVENRYGGGTGKVLNCFRRSLFSAASRGGEEEMQGTGARPSNIRTEIGERIADLRDSLALTREMLCRAVAENAPESDIQTLRLQVMTTLDAIDKLQAFERPRL
jgi:hypothetical protein